MLCIFNHFCYYYSNKSVPTTESLPIMSPNWECFKEIARLNTFWCTFSYNFEKIIEIKPC